MTLCDNTLTSIVELLSYYMNPYMHSSETKRLLLTISSVLRALQTLPSLRGRCRALLIIGGASEELDGVVSNFAEETLASYKTMTLHVEDGSCLFGLALRHKDWEYLKTL